MLQGVTGVTSGDNGFQKLQKVRRYDKEIQGCTEGSGGYKW